MLNSFKNILIPVDLAENTEVAVKKGLELADKDTVIHLLHVQNDSVNGKTNAARKKMADAYELSDRCFIEKQLSELKWFIEELHEIDVCTWIVPEEKIQKAIENKARQLKIDLIIIAKNSHHSWFPFLNTVVPSSIAKRTGIAVLTVKPGSVDHTVRTVIVSMCSEVTKRKLEIISAICRKFKVKIYLVTFTKNGNAKNDDNASALLQVYQWLNTTIHCPVEYAVLDGPNKAKAILDYAEKINADILLIHPESETTIGWLNKQISDVIPPASKLQVLTLEQASLITR
jgi:nucleotide-binding universal stress UspA family protein